MIIKSKLDDLIDEAIAELNPMHTDDMLVEMQEDPALIEEAVDFLIEELNKRKE